jgi:hypothetical protein
MPTLPPRVALLDRLEAWGQTSGSVRSSGASTGWRQVASHTRNQDIQRHLPLPCAWWGPTVSRGGLHHVSCYRRHAALHGAWWAPTLPTGGLLQPRFRTPRVLQALSRGCVIERRAGDSTVTAVHCCAGGHDHSGRGHSSERVPGGSAVRGRRLERGATPCPGEVVQAAIFGFRFHHDGFARSWRWRSKMCHLVGVAAAMPIAIRGACMCEGWIAHTVDDDRACSWGNRQLWWEERFPKPKVSAALGAPVGAARS